MACGVLGGKCYKGALGGMIYKTYSLYNVHYKKGEIELLMVKVCFEELIMLRVVARGDPLRLIYFSFQLCRPAFQASSGPKWNDMTKSSPVPVKWA